MAWPQASPMPYDWSEDMPQATDPYSIKKLVTVEPVPYESWWRWKCKQCGKQGADRRMKELAESDAAWHERWHKDGEEGKDPSS